MSPGVGRMEELWHRDWLDCETHIVYVQVLFASALISAARGLLLRIFNLALFLLKT